jgi:hypothetical protein
VFAFFFFSAFFASLFFSALFFSAFFSAFYTFVVLVQLLEILRKSAQVGEKGA